MNVFTIITTLLGLLLSAISTAIGIAGYKQTPGNPPPSPAPSSSSNVSSPQSYPISNTSDAQQDNQKFKNELLYWTVIATVFIILALWGIYGWNYITVPLTTDIPILNLGEKLTHMLYFSLFNTLRIIIWIIPIFSIGLVAIYIKNPHAFYRIFHIISYSAITISSCICGIKLIQGNYQMFSPTRATANTLSLKNFLQTEAIVILFLLAVFIIYVLLFLTRISIFGELKSSYMRKNCRHVIERIIAPILFVAFTFAMYYIA